MRSFTAVVRGKPTPQGSKRGIPIKRKNGKVGAVVVDQSGDRLETWRQDVRGTVEAVLAQIGHEEPYDGAVEVIVTFFQARPKSHYGTGRNADRVKPSAPDYPTKKPDVDKLVRGVLDALTSAGVYRDDSQVIHLDTSKHYGPTPGANITVTPL